MHCKGRIVTASKYERKEAEVVHSTCTTGCSHLLIVYVYINTVRPELSMTSSLLLYMHRLACRSVGGFECCTEGAGAALPSR
jgi:hypothetical protein